MAQVILSATDTETDVFDKDYFGTYQLICLVASTVAVKLEVRDPDYNDTWVTARFNSTEIEFDTAGDTFDMEFTKGFEYRLTVATAGAVISMDRHG